MKLDSKIINGKKPLTPFDTEEAKNYIGKECYFTNDISKFSCITDALAKGALTSVKDNNEPYQHKGILSEFNSAFILPCEWITKEKKYRPFTAYEFQRLFNIGDVICIRRKNTKVVENLLYAGFKSDAGNLPCILLGNEWHDFGELLADFEYIDDSDFKPFGVEE